MKNLNLEKVTALSTQNSAFLHKIETINSRQVHQLTYFQPSPDDFFDAFKDGSDFNATELRGITYVEEEDEVKRFIFINKFFNFGQTNGTATTIVKLTINGLEEVLNINALYETQDGKIYRAVDLKLNLVVKKYNVDINIKNDFITIKTIQKEIVNDYNPDNSWMLHDCRDYEVIRMSVKEDGSAIRFIKINGKLYAKTKFAFQSEQALMAMEIVENDLELKNFIEETIEKGFAALFEIVSPFNTIVLKYKNTELRLLQMREEETGLYLDIYNNDIVKKYANLKLAASFDIELIKVIVSKYNLRSIKDLIKDNKYETIESLLLDITDNLSINGSTTFLDFMDLIKDNIVGVEGWVLTIIKDGKYKLGKTKTKWYMDLHHTLTDGLKEHILIDKILNEEIDDILSAIPEDNKEEREFINKITNITLEYFHETINKCIAIVKEEYDGDKKSFVAKYKGNKKLFSYLMATIACDSDIERLGEVVKNDILKQARKLEMAKTFLSDIGLES